MKEQPIKLDMYVVSKENDSDQYNYTNLFEELKKYRLIFITKIDRKTSYYAKKRFNNMINKEEGLQDKSVVMSSHAKITTVDGSVIEGYMFAIVPKNIYNA